MNKPKSRYSYSGILGSRKPVKNNYLEKKIEKLKKEKKMRKNYSHADFTKRRKSKNTITGKRKKKIGGSQNPMTKSGNNNGAKTKTTKLSRYGQIKRKLDFSNPNYSRGITKKKSKPEPKNKIIGKGHYRSNSFDKGYVSDSNLKRKLEKLFPRKSVKSKGLRRNQSLQLNIEDLDLDEKEFEIEEEEPKKVEIKLIPTVESFTMRTRRGRNGDEDKTNQDSFVAQPNFSGDDGAHIFGVYDGHGN